MKARILEQINQSYLFTDGAMGTYYEKKTNKKQIVEWANINDQDTIVTIHKEYLQAGSSLIRTNTFAANTVVMGIDKEQRNQIIMEGYQLANRAVVEYKDEQLKQEKGSSIDQNRELFVAADIGPIPIHGERTIEENIEEYKEICQCFLDAGADIFLFETFSNFNGMKEVIDYISNQNPDACIIVNFCINKNGYTMSGVRAQKLIDEVASIQAIDICGLNCGIGSGHMASLLQNLHLPTDKPIAILPNAGYPEQLHNRMVFANNIRYFVDNITRIRNFGVSILGGCCGTTPNYISELVKASTQWSYSCEVKQKQDMELKVNTERDVITYSNPVSKLISHSSSKNIEIQESFMNKLNQGKKVIAVELDPPYDSDDSKLMACIERVKNQNVDIITIADSPMGRSRVDSILMSTKIMNQYQIPVMPHVCCRDKNMIAMRSTLLGAYLNGIRNMLLVTGDPVPSEQRLSTTNVFDYNSIRLMNFVKQMNEEHFIENPIHYGGALNPGLQRVDKVIERMQKKIEEGATYFLTQPIYSDEVIERIQYIKSQVDTKILCGIMPFVSYRNANFIKNEFSGITVPDEYVERYSPDMSKEDAENIGVEIGKELMKKLEPYADGFYFMLPFNRVSMLEKILQE